MSNLSKENYHKLNENYLYECKPFEKDYGVCGAYWCKNWTFKVEFTENGKAFMVDTYFNDSYIEVTDENITEFKFVFDFREVKKVRDSETSEYDYDKLYCVATDSGGTSCGNLYWRDKNTEKSKERLIENKKSEINSLESQLKCAKKDLEKLVST